MASRFLSFFSNSVIFCQSMSKSAPMRPEYSFLRSFCTIFYSSSPISDAFFLISSSSLSYFSTNSSTSFFSFYKQEEYPFKAYSKSSSSFLSFSTFFTYYLKLTDSSLLPWWWITSHSSFSQLVQKKACCWHSGLRQTSLAYFLLMQVGKPCSLSLWVGFSGCFCAVFDMSINNINKQTYLDHSVIVDRFSLHTLFHASVLVYQLCRCLNNFRSLLIECASVLMFLRESFFQCWPCC